jgi:lipopolysaccharide/colanic/teichoic acid biosynthesis glycosyltransferase
MKRLFDFIAASVGLVVLSPVFLLVAIMIKLDSRGPVFFRQERIGKGFRPFRIYKFRTMVQDAPRMGSLITSGDDPRITKIGRFLRKTKIDELPQLINILKGEMSLVGPRPEVAQYVELFRHEYEEILKVRPGITDVASLKYRDESVLLGTFSNPSEEYLTRILPDKIRLAKEYVERRSVVFDITLILKTFLKLFGRTIS